MIKFKILKLKVSFFLLLLRVIYTHRQKPNILQIDTTHDAFKSAAVSKLFSKNFYFIIDTGSPFTILDPSIREITSITYPSYEKLSSELNCRVCRFDACCLSMNFIQARIPVIVASIKNVTLFNTYFPVFYFLLPLEGLPGNLNHFSILGIGSTYSSSTNPFGVINLNEQLKENSITKILLFNDHINNQTNNVITIKHEPNKPHISFFAFSVHIDTTVLVTYSNSFNPLIQIDTGSSNICINKRIINNFYNKINNYCIKENIEILIDKTRGLIVIEKAELEKIKMEFKFELENRQEFKIKFKLAFIWDTQIEKYTMFIDECVGDVALLLGWDVLRNYNIELDLNGNYIELSNK